MTKPYVSSIISKYGDTDKVKEDVKTLNDIISRQSAELLIDVIAEHTGTVANKFEFSPSARSMTMIALVDALENALKQRL